MFSKPLALQCHFTHPGVVSDDDVIEHGEVDLDIVNLDPVTLHHPHVSWARPVTVFRVRLAHVRHRCL